MKLKFDRNLKNLPNQEQLQEIASFVMSEPDVGWEKDFENAEPISERHKAYITKWSGAYGTYHYKVNLSWELITITKID